MASSSKAEGRVLLPLNVNPIRYDLTLTPDLQAFTFDGVCKIEVQTLADTTKEVQLHAKEILFHSANFLVKDSSSSAPVECEEFRVNVKETVATLIFESPLPPNSTLLLTIVYSGFLNNQMSGFYRSTYQNVDGESKIMASTQFEALDARRCFPCWDEPARKAIFGVTLIIDSHLDCLSNMPESRRQRLPTTTSAASKKTQVTFLDSPKMSTYLLAFLVGELDYVQTVSPKSGTIISVATPPGKSHTGLFALDCASRCLDAFNDFFGIPYPLPKLDMVAIPEFAAGAMENWGLVTYREVDLLIDPQTASNAQKQRVCTVVTHELSHQWFGNLVTMQWWDDLWLNEGFASWAENWAAHELFPDYEMWNQFTVGHFSHALRLDALKSSHPIQVPIHHAKEVEEIFDAVSYCKGGSVVRMCRAVLGMKAFRQGLSTYMKKHAYGNTETFDLWNAWEEASGMPVAELMASWTEQMGFPFVRITKETWKDDSVELELEQSWFLSNGAELTEEEAKKKWTIPIMTCTATGTQEDMVLMKEKIGKVTIPISGPGAWVKLNAGQEVPFRVLNTPEMFARMADGIKTKSMPECDRAALLADAYAFVKAGSMAPDVLIRLIANYEKEDSYIVWNALADVLGGLDTVMSDDEKMSANFLVMAKKIVVGLVDQVGWAPSPTDGHLTVLLRSIMIGLLCTFCYDEENVAKEAKTRFEKFLLDATDVESLPSDMRSSVFKIVLKNGGVKEYEQVLSYFDTATDNAERKHVFASLGSAKSPELKKRTLEWTTSGAVKLQDFFYAMGSVGRSSKEGREISWQFYQDNFEKIKKMIGKGNPSLMDACIVSCGGSFCSEKMADEIDAFFEANPVPQSVRKIAQTTENMRANGKFLAALQASPLSSDSFWTEL